MGLKVKTRAGKKYYYLNLSYRVLTKSQSFAKYLGLKKPTNKKIKELEEDFKDKIIEKISGKKYGCNLISKDDVIRTFLFRDAFNKKFKALSPTKRKKYEIDSTILFTLTTLTTEDVDVSLDDVARAYEQDYGLTAKEKISKNMIDAVEQIKKKQEFTKKYLLDLHSLTMKEFENKTPGLIRTKDVYIHKRDEKNPLGIEISYKPPKPEQITKLLDDFVAWVRGSKLNPLEKSVLAHYKLYLIHPFLDGNKRTCRLIFNKILLDCGFPLMNISDKRSQYFDSLIKSTEKQDPEFFVKFSKEQYFKQIKTFLEK
ncbi:MAG: Fic family protein [Candidatus ainarchaeum sp.]|nr:Fic family protein [Candidatus ainarchaeum sp.]